MAVALLTKIRLIGGHHDGFAVEVGMPARQRIDIPWAFAGVYFCDQYVLRQFVHENGQAGPLFYISAALDDDDATRLAAQAVYW